MSDSYGKIDRLFRKGLRNTDLEREPFMVFFTGLPFSGKSTVAKVLQHRYDMVRIENDRLREIKDRENVDIDAYDYIIDFVKNYSYPNKRGVQDSSIDRIYEDIIPHCKEKEIPYFIIKMPVPEDMDERAREKGGIYLENWKNSSKEKFLREHRKAVQDLKINFKFGEDGGIKELLEELDQELDKE
jgi:adenylate kinase family enzyme